MTKEEIGKIIDSKQYPKTMRCYGDDKYGNLIKGIFYDGMRAGYDLAKFRLELLDGMPFGAADDYLAENMEKIKEIVCLCEQYENA